MEKSTFEKSTERVHEKIEEISNGLRDINDSTEAINFLRRHKTSQLQSKVIDPARIIESSLDAILISAEVIDNDAVSNQIIDWIDLEIEYYSSCTQKIKSSREFTVSQIVYGFDKLGLFDEETAFHKLSDVKKAKILSRFIGANDQNIRECIMDLSRKPSEVKQQRKDGFNRIDSFLQEL